jgi:hypothetical protein
VRTRSPTDRVDLTGAALGYAARGLAVLPVRGKIPVVAHGVNDATLDRRLIRDRFADPSVTGVGIACGPSRLIVVDLDGDDGQAEWANLAARHDGHAPTAVADTGGGGVHVFFRGTARSTVGALGRGIDTRGRGGYIVAPPSVHPSGRRYRWRPSSAPLAEAPGWLLDLLQPPPPPPVGEARPLPPGVLATTYGQAALAGLTDDLLAAAEGTRNAALHTAARRAGRLVAAGELDEALARDMLTDAARAAGLSGHEIASTWRSGFGYGIRFPAVRGPR